MIARITLFSLAICLCIISIAFAPDVFSQSIRYMDESGNLHFVDSIYQVPPKYRDQVLMPTPAPTGRVKPTRRPTPTRKPTKTPNQQKRGQKQGSLPQNAVFSNFPETKPGELPAVTPLSQIAPSQVQDSQPAKPRQGGLRPPPLPLMGSGDMQQAVPPGVPGGVLAPGVAPAATAAPQQ